MSTKKTKTAKPEAKATKKAPAKKAEKLTGPQREGKLSALDAAAKVLAETGEPMNAKALIEAMATKGYWTSPGGQTPHATLFAALSREIKVKGTDSRFVKADRGQFALNAGAGTAAAPRSAEKAKPAAKAKATGKKGKQENSSEIADGTPGPKSVSELLKI